MSSAIAIGLVAETLRDLLEGEMQLAPSVDVSILAPDEPGSNRRVNLFLYKVQENSFLRNQDWQVKPGAPGQLMPPPLALNLYYLVTPYANNDPQTGNSTAHEILGEAMRVFYENAVVPELYLANGLKAAREQIKITPSGLDMEELSRVWSTFSQPFRLSVLYEVSVVQIDQSAATERVMPPRVIGLGVPSVGAPYAPPQVQRLEPASGPAGGNITAHGQHLQGWKAYARMTGRSVLAGLNIENDSFTIPVPADLSPGFHEIRIDISHLHRSTFFFQVTA